jgi:tetratricopeptide (TPR) repeat protein
LTDHRHAVSLTVCFSQRREERRNQQEANPEQTEGHELDALRVSPHDTDANIWTAYIALSKLFLGDDEAALVMYRRAFEINQNYPIGHFLLAATLAELGRIGEARAALQGGLALNPGFTIRRYREGARSDNPAFLKRREQIIEAMRKAGVPEE